MSTIVISVGNPLRRDDGVAHAVRKYVNCKSQSVIQLVPEMAEAIAGYDTIIFIDADTRSRELRVDPVTPTPCAAAFAHSLSPASIVTLSRTLFGFNGRAFICRIPIVDLSYGTGLSTKTTRLVKRVANLLGQFLVEP